MTSAAHFDDDMQIVPAVTLFGRIEAEIAATAAVLRDLQDALSPLGASLDPTLVMRMQSLDLAEQTLRDLSAALAVMAEGPSGTMPVDADRVAAPCKLADVARRLRGDDAAPAQADIDFF